MSRSAIVRRAALNYRRDVEVLSEEMTRREITEALAGLRFDVRNGGVRTIAIDREVRDALVGALRGR
jgi:hypothetical protein